MPLMKMPSTLKPLRRLRKMLQKPPRKEKKIRKMQLKTLKKPRKTSKMLLKILRTPTIQKISTNSKRSSMMPKRISPKTSKMLPRTKLSSKKTAESTKTMHQISMTQVTTTAMAQLNGSSYHLMMRLKKTLERSGSSQKMTKMKDMSSSAVLTSQ